MSGFRSLFRLEPPFDDGELAEYRTTLQAVPKVYEQARSNLTEAVPDLGTIAIWAAPREARIYDEITEQLAGHHPDLIADAEAARDAVLAFGAWVEENKSSWSGASRAANSVRCCGKRVSNMKLIVFSSFFGASSADVAASKASASGPWGSIMLCSDRPPGTKPSGLAS